MRRSPILVAVSVLVLTVGGQQALATSSTGRTGPAPVRQLRAFDDEPGISFTWKNPTAKGFSYVAVRYAKSSRPPGRHSGHEVHVARRATSTKLTGLTRDTTYTVNVWAYYADGRSSAQHVRFTTDGSPGAGRGRFLARYVDQAGNPLAGVQVYAYAADFSTDTVYRASSGGDGRVGLNLPAGSYVVYADGTDAVGGSFDSTGYLGDAQDVTIRPGRSLDEGPTVLDAGGAVEVHVVDTHGRPVAGVVPGLAPVIQYVSDNRDDDIWFNAWESLAYGRTDSRGDALLRGVYPGEAFRVCANPVNSVGDALDGGRYLANCTITSRVARAGQRTTAPTLTLQRQPGASISGTVRGIGSHSGFENATIEILRGRHIVATTVSRSHGAFRAAGLVPGRYRVCAVDGPFSQLGRSGFLPGCAAGSVSVPTSLAGQQANIVLRPAAAVTGTITGPHGAPAHQAGIQFSHDTNSGYEPDLTDAYGHFLIKGLRPGPNSMCVYADNMHATQRLPRAVLGSCGQHSVHFVGVRGRIATGVDARLPAGGAVVGTIVDAGGRVVPNAFLDVTPLADSGPGSNDDRESVPADRQGRFDIVGLHSGRYQICAGVGTDPADSGSVSRCRQAVRVVAGRTVRGIRFVVPRTSGIEVTAVNKQGLRIAGADAAAIRPCNSNDLCNKSTPLLARRYSAVVDSETTGSAGHAQLTTLLPGKYAVCLFAFYATTRVGPPNDGFADKCTGTTFTVVVRAGRTTNIRIVLDQAGSVTGRVTDTSGHPLKNVVVHVAGSAADDLPQNPFYDGNGFAGYDGGASADPAFYSKTSTDGTFTIRSVRPGNRLVCFSTSRAIGGTSQGGYLAQCAGGSPGNKTNGKPVAVVAGSGTRVDIALAAGGSVTGQITTAVAKAPIAVVIFNGDTYVTQTRAAKDGTYRVTRLAAGTYQVCGVAFGSAAEYGRCYRDAAWDPNTGSAPTSDPTPVVVSSGSATPDVSFHIPD